MELDMGVGDEVPPIDETALFLSSFGLNPYNPSWLTFHAISRGNSMVILR